jgi:hypothetical protein
MGFFKKPTLRNRDDQRTRAAELTLRESIYPLMLVTILFFLWVSRLAFTLIRALATNPHSGVLVRSYRHSEQALPRHPWYNPLSFFRPASGILRCIPSRFPWPCELDPPTLGLQSYFHLGSHTLWCWLIDCLAVPSIPLVWRLLRSHLRHWKWARLP